MSSLNTSSSNESNEAGATEIRKQTGLSMKKGIITVSSTQISSSSIFETHDLQLKSENVRKIFSAIDFETLKIRPITEDYGETTPPNSNDSLNSQETASKLLKKGKKKKKRYFAVNLTSCKYECVRRVTKRFGFREVTDSEDWTLFWTDYSVSLERVIDMKTYQKINHFPGMSEICRKDLLARNMNRLWKQFPKEFAIFPRTWCMPADYGDFQAFCRLKKHKTFILKPDSGSQGKGIYLTKNIKDIKPGEDLICQQYITRPFLIDGLKFDLRIYVVVTSCDPLRVFVHRDGLARFATVKYSEPTNNNLGNVFMHLTNYAIQKNSDEFVRDDEFGSKRKISAVNKWFENNGYDIKRIWSAIDDVIVKTLIAAHPILKHNYRTCFPNHSHGSACFEILGFDVILDKKLRPWVLEVNHSPSFTTDSRLDREIKEALVHDTLVLVNFNVYDKRKYIEEERRRVRQRLFQKTVENKEEEVDENVNIALLKKYEDENMGHFRRIYPENNEEVYEQYFANSCSLFQETAASKARSECARLQREKIKTKKEHIDMMRRKNGILSQPADGMRPESGVNKKKPTQKKKNLYVKKNFKVAPAVRMDVWPNSQLPMTICQHDEMERIGQMIQRHNLLKSVGLPDMLYKLLNNRSRYTQQQMVTNNNKFNNRDEANQKASMKSLCSMTTYPPKPTMGIATTTKGQHWIMSGPPILNRKERKLLASAGINFNNTPNRFGKKLSNHQKNEITYRKEVAFNYIGEYDTKPKTATNSKGKLQTKRGMQRENTCELSVISSPAPLLFRSDSLREVQTTASVQSNLENRNRSTRAQRIRGASNTIRLKQKEILDNNSNF